MAQDIRDLLKASKDMNSKGMPKGHEARFLEKLEEAMPQESKASRRWSFLNIAASVVLLIGLGYAGFKVGMPTTSEGVENPDAVTPTEMASKSGLGEISPQLKKVEDYYVANINNELAKIEYTPENKELFDGYVDRMEVLSKEYDRLADELIQSGPNESTVNALIDNLKLRLNLLYRLKEKLNELNNTNNTALKASNG